jgi:hypothetical protein
MRIKQYVVTYNSPKILNEWYLNSFFESSAVGRVEHFIINNHSNFEIYDPIHAGHLTVLNNVLRPDFSTGHLARNWNQALINGFKSLTNPDADIVILVQQDTLLDPDYLDKVIEIHSTRQFYTDGAGDQFHSYTAAHVKTVGIWDERFCGIGFQEADYLLRSILYNSHAISLNDEHHGRTWNVDMLKAVKTTTTGYHRRDPHHVESSKFHDCNKDLWYWKYTIDHWDWHKKKVLDDLSKVVRNNMWFLTYPYFEKDVETLRQQGYPFRLPVETPPWG